MVSSLHQKKCDAAKLFIIHLYAIILYSGQEINALLAFFSGCCLSQSKAFCLGRTVTTIHIITKELHLGYYFCNHPFLGPDHLRLATLRASSAQNTTVRLHYLPSAPVTEKLRTLTCSYETLLSYVWGCRHWLEENLCAAELPQLERNVSITGERSVYSPFTSFIFSPYIFLRCFLAPRCQNTLFLAVSV